MKVKWLIEELQKCDPDMMVVVSGYEGGVDELSKIKRIDVALNVNTDWYYGKHEEIITVNDAENKDVVKATVIHLT
jgi:hypothetical protein